MDFPRANKDAVSVCPILSIPNPHPHHQLARCLIEAIQPVSQCLAVHRINDTFDFIDQGYDTDVLAMKIGIDSSRLSPFSSSSSVRSVESMVVRLKSLMQ